MRKIGFASSDKKFEKRLAILPEHFLRNVSNKQCVFFETGYFLNFGYRDEDLMEKGLQFISKEEIYKLDVIVDPKIGDSSYLDNLKDDAILFGWHHLVQNHELTKKCIEKKFTTYCWENMFDKNVHTFYRNNQLAGEASVLHALMCFGLLPDSNTKVCIIGNGNTARGALSVLTKFGVDPIVYTPYMEDKFKSEFKNYDIIVNAVLWDTNRNDYLISRNDLKKMKRNSLIIDISCDHDGAIETSSPTDMDCPMRLIDGVYHYAVDHTPTIFFQNASRYISTEVSKYLDYLIEDKFNPVLEKSIGIKKGIVIDKNIKVF